MTAIEFHQNMALGYFKPIYPAIARNILRKCPVRKGLCVDVGGGTGVLAVEIARQTMMAIYSIDADVAAIEIAQGFIKDEGMAHRIVPILGNAEELPLNDATAMLVVSRGSVFFWHDKVKGMNEIYRILKPGGYAYIGGGMGSIPLKRQIVESLSENENWKTESTNRYRRNLPIHLNLMMRQTVIPDWTMEASEEGTWIFFRKSK